MIRQFLMLATLVSAGAGDEQTLQPSRGPESGFASIGSLRVDQHGNGRATVHWRTDRPTTSRVEYATGISIRQQTGAPGYTLDHNVQLSGLQSSTAYSYHVVSTDRQGRESTSNRRAFTSAGEVLPATGFTAAGQLRVWYPTTLSFVGPYADESDDAPNPFLDYRLSVHLVAPNGDMLTIPGFFDGNGRGAGAGDTWRVRFSTHVPGTWKFTASFVEGSGVALDETLSSGTPTSFDGLSGQFDILPADPRAPGHYAEGKLVYSGEHHLRFQGGAHFLKAGSNSPENFLGYAGFDNTEDHGGLSTSGLVDGLHRYAPHVDDWGPRGLGGFEDPLFTSADTGVDSRGIVGALNYLGTVHVNSLFFLPMNLGGDGWETCPFIDYRDRPDAKIHYDISKLDQWNQVFEHAARKGIQLQIVLNENEDLNKRWLDNATLGVERKLFYRELVARFGHLPAIKWNLSEECDFGTSVLNTFSGYLSKLDPYGQPIGFHLDVLPLNGSSPQWSAVLGDPRYMSNSIQAIPYTASAVVEKWRSDSAAMGQPWVIDFDEQTLPLTNLNAETLRKRVLYDVLFSGGNIEWYAGYQALPVGGDLRLEDFRVRAEMWNYSWYARKFLEENVPFWGMTPKDSLVAGENGTEGGAEVLALEGRYYAVYYPSASKTGTLNLRGLRAVMQARWYNPRTGLFEGSPTVFSATGLYSPGAPPSDPSEDWVLLVKRGRKLR